MELQHIAFYDFRQRRDSFLVADILVEQPDGQMIVTVPVSSLRDDFLEKRQKRNTFLC